MKLTKKGKVFLGVIAFALIAATGFLLEHLESDAFIEETVATEDPLPYVSESDTQIDGKININSASAVELVAIKGIGESLAQRIIRFREENGPFMTTEEIVKVSGISETTYEKIKDFICAE